LILWYLDSLFPIQRVCYLVSLWRNYGVGQFNVSNVAIIAHGLSDAAVTTLDESYTTTIYFIYWV